LFHHTIGNQRIRFRRAFSDHQENHDVLLLLLGCGDDDGKNIFVSGNNRLGDRGSTPSVCCWSTSDSSGAQAFTLVLVCRCISHSYERTSAIVIDIQSSIHANAWRWPSSRISRIVCAKRTPKTHTLYNTILILHKVGLDTRGPRQEFLFRAQWLFKKPKKQW
jgi:hypothetical protein